MDRNVKQRDNWDVVRNLKKYFCEHFPKTSHERQQYVG